MTVRPSVFVCYTHDSPWHKQQVLDFCTFLVAAGIEVCVDQWQPPERQDWYRWALDKIPSADFVLAIASPEFREAADGRVPAERNRGAQAEATVLRELLQDDRPMWTKRILPVVLPGRAVEEIPMFLQPRTADHYIVESFTEEGAEYLLSALRRAPSRPTPAHRAKPVPPPKPHPSSGNVQHIVSNGSGSVYANQGGEQTIHHR
ncbi:MAG: toll/interleukin-1 receptor domain-containing protein [Umezawaea sp.]